MPTRRPATAGRLSAALATLLLVAACANGPTPRSWAASVCEALAPWRAQISELTRITDQQMTAQTTPAQARENLVRLFGGAERASETARRKVEQAGVPEVREGEAVSSGFQESLRAVRDAYGRARRSIEALGTDQPAAFYAGVRSVVETLNAEYGASALDTSKLNSVELKKAFDEVPECR